MVIQVRESGPPLADDDLADLERRLGIALPAEYRAFLLAHNGGVPRAEWFRLPIRDEWIAARRSAGRMRWYGYCYNNWRMAGQLKDWHRVGWFLGVGASAGALDLEHAYYERPSGLPERLAVVAEVSSFQINGWLCIDITAGGPDQARVLYWPDVTPASGETLLEDTASDLIHRELESLRQVCVRQLAENAAPGSLLATRKHGPMRVPLSSPGG